MDSGSDDQWIRSLEIIKADEEICNEEFRLSSPEFPDQSKHSVNSGTTRHCEASVMDSYEKIESEST